VLAHDWLLVALVLALQVAAVAVVQLAPSSASSGSGQATSGGS